MGRNVFDNDIFISYRHEGGAIAANHLAEKLRNDGYTVTFDKKSLRAGLFDKQILKYINSCTDFIVILDKNVFEKTLRGEPLEDDWLRRELAHAIKMEKNIIPIPLENFVKPHKKELPNDIADVVSHQFIKYDIEKFDKFYDDLCNDGYLKTPNPQKNLFRKYWKTSLGTLIFLLCMLLIFFIGKNSVTQPERLIFAGGGSVSNLIDSLVGHKGDTAFIRTYENAYYLNLATENAWSLLLEEKKKDKNTREQNHFHSICLSAERISDDSVFMKKIKLDKPSDGLIVGISLGYDTLEVLIHDDFNKYGVDKTDKSISTENLKKILTDTFNIYTTTIQSGTFRSYSENMKPDSLQFMIESRQKFFSKDEPAETASIENIFLASKYYYPKLLSDSYTPLILMKDGEVCRKPMFLYFVVYKDNDKNIYYTVAEPIRRFLEKVVNKIGIEKYEDKELYKAIINDGKLSVSKYHTNTVLELKFK